MKTFTILISSFLLSLPAFSQHDMGEVKPAELLTGIGNLHHPVSTSNPEAQKYFDQGLTMVYGFNHAEAIKAFQKAAELDPNLAMAYWGIGYGLGPNYNLDADADQKKQAYEAVQKALQLMVNASDAEKDYINALSKRYSSDPKADQKVLNGEFRVAMRELAKKYPDDLDAQTLYAESMMILRPWQLWNADGAPAEGTLEIVSVLETVLKKDPNHIGANHYYIHAVEASNDPGRGLASAKVLGGLVPVAGHLVHMPAHIFFRVGDYENAAVANVNAIKSDDDYFVKTGATGVYPLMYYNHNINFLSVARLMEGNFKDAYDEANKVVANVMPYVKEMPMVEAFVASPLLVLVTFHKWAEILTYPDHFKGMTLAPAFRHFARGLAYANIGRISNAKKQLKKVKKWKSKLPPDAMVGLNSASMVLEVAVDMLAGVIELADGETQEGIALLRKAVREEDALSYDEPPDWYPSVRWTLGSVLYSIRDYAGAEKVFREDLKKYPHNGRGLFGLYNCLMKLGKNDEAGKVETEFKEAWKHADVKLTIEDLW